LIEFAATLIGSVATLMLAFSGRGVWSPVFGSLIKEAGNAVRLMTVSRFRVAPLLDFTGLRTVLAFGMKISGARIVWYFNSSFDGLLIGKVVGDRALGLYSGGQYAGVLTGLKGPRPEQSDCLCCLFAPAR
jgi:teichuronic acid exporter